MTDKIKKDAIRNNDADLFVDWNINIRLATIAYPKQIKVLVQQEVCAIICLGRFASF